MGRNERLTVFGDDETNPFAPSKVAEQIYINVATTLIVMALAECGGTGQIRLLHPDTIMQPVRKYAEAWAEIENDSP